MTESIVNTEQAAAWNGDEGRDWVAHEEQYNAAIRRNTTIFFDRVPIDDDANILDIGCGCGESTRLAAERAPRGQAIGIDLSAGMLARATERARAHAITNATFVQGDAQVYPFNPAASDLAISRYGVMFFSDPDAAFRNIARALAPGGSLAVLTWQGLDHNPWMRAIREALAAGRVLPVPPPGAPGVFSLADADRTTELLSRAGFRDIVFTEVRERVHVGDTADDAFEFVSQMGVARGLLQGLEAEARASALDALRDVLADHETNDGVLLESGSWLVTAQRSPDDGAVS
jgi:SAM-dependent methyltransferase